MSEEAKIFRGDQAPESGAVEPVRRARPVAPAPAAVAVPSASEPEAAAVPTAKTAPTASTPTVAAEPEPALDFHVDESQLWHSSEAVKQRISAMAAVAHETAHLLDEQAAEAERIAKQLKSL